MISVTDRVLLVIPMVCVCLRSGTCTCSAVYAVVLSNARYTQTTDRQKTLLICGGGGATGIHTTHMDRRKIVDVANGTRYSYLR